ncbi:Mov34/MPN/PAD-1 family protein [Pseudomonas tolaasii]|uniref:Mov34/MPN/PAD-1 family protein n=1 Tax=Pseudomonas tolaasii TaxID=29442 RepID=UPI002733A79E|nr:Mov34/MPN/PAD-1 family protein [Pseudomonas tolaasii]WLH51304.1 Mov34/MPN/PAD-1 family protein [Pseudomonas tolaasii]
MIEYFELGEARPGLAEDSLYPHTQALLKALRACPNTDVREIRLEPEGQGKSEYIVITAGDGTVDAGNPAGIRRRERLAIGINPDYRVPVLIHTLRKDFPQLSHQHPRIQDRPRQLCLYDNSWSAIEQGWTPQRFIARMFWWLRESAQLKLHRDDQPLEHLFYMSEFQLILPADYVEYSKPGGRTLTVMRCDREARVLKAVPSQPGDTSKGMRTISVFVDPVDANLLVAIPETLGDLQDQLASWGSGLYKQLYDTVYDAIGESITVDQRNAAGKGEGIIILVWIPRTRDGKPDRFDVVGYMLTHSLFDLASALDMLGMPESGRYPRIVLLGGEPSTKWRSFPLMPVEIRSGLTPKHARDMSGIPDGGAEVRGILAGVGALGSVLADLWIRQGWGQWTLVDPDLLLPHNLSRHTGFDTVVGLHKVDAVREIAAAAFPTWEPPKAIAGSVLNEGDETASALSAAEILIDVTTTLEVPRMLAKKSNVPRTASLFLTPSGLSSVMILEDLERRQRVDSLEGQYYRAILQNEWGREHLAQHLGDRWVGGGCRDISLRMPNECIHTHAGILARQLRQSVAQPQARICVWESDDETGSISAHEVELALVHSTELTEWTVKYDAAFVDKLRQTRIEALPNETGGSILGVTDLKTKTIVVVDVLPTPPDSEASPNHFVRGQEGQAEALENVRKRTANVVDYVGEWHSHPDGCPARPSNYDETLLDTLQRQMSAEGLPALMIIAGQTELGVFVR